MLQLPTWKEGSVEVHSSVKRSEALLQACCLVRIQAYRHAAPKLGLWRSSPNLADISARCYMRTRTIGASQEL